jgi:hypothetical protein
MNELDIIVESFGELRKLALKSPVFLEDVPLRFRPDVQSFIVGETLTMWEGKIIIGNNLYKKWLQKIRKKGFDYEIDFKR